MCILKDKVKLCIKQGCTYPVEKIGKTSTQKKIPAQEDKIITLPVFGKVDTSKMMLPVLTIILAGLDSFNPINDGGNDCACNSSK